MNGILRGRALFNDYIICSQSNLPTTSCPNFQCFKLLILNISVGLSQEIKHFCLITLVTHSKETFMRVE